MGSYAVPVLSVPAHHQLSMAFHARPPVNVPYIGRHIFGQKAGPSVHDSHIEIVGIKHASHVGTRLTRIIGWRFPPNLPRHDAGVAPMFKVWTGGSHKGVVVARRSAIDIG